MKRPQAEDATLSFKWFFTFALLIAVITQLCLTDAIAKETPAGWHAWLKEFKKEAMADGIRPDVFNKALRHVVPDKRVVRFDRSQPEKRLTFKEYRSTRVDAYRIKLGKKKYRQYQTMLQEIASDYGVDPCIIVALWGMESSYGHFKGNFPVIKSLATLAFDGRRSDFFRAELLHALHIVQEGHVQLADLKGEWAGASGHPQFLPSSWRNYAVDRSGDGHKDIWNNVDDAFASIANYLKQNGWESDQPWAVEVNAPKKLARGFDEAQQPLAKWLQMGVDVQQKKRRADQMNPDLAAWLIEPYGGPAMLAFNNFKVIKRYNNSNYYAGSVGYLADQICRR